MSSATAARLFLGSGRDFLVELDLRHGGLALAGVVLPVRLVVSRLHGGWR